MKTKTKLLTALLSTVTALSCALTAAAATAPALTLNVDETPVSAGMKDNTATATLTAAEFGSVGGVDITLSLPEGISLNSAEVVNTAEGSTWTLTKDANYKVDAEKNTVRIIDAFNVGSSVDVAALELKITFAIDSASIGDYVVGVTAVMADTDAAKMDATDNTVTGKIVVSRSYATYTADTSEAVRAALTVANDQFIPYGGVYVSDGNKFPEKKGDGTFDTAAITGEFTVLKCKLPANTEDVTTFGVSSGTAGDGKDDKAIQFGSYVPTKSADTTYGTFIIIGDYEAFKADKGIANDEAALQRFAELYKFSKDEENTKFMKFTYNGSESILVGRKTQTNIMWNSNDETILQYALRIYNITDSAKLYTAVGYSLNEGTYNFSAEIKSASLNSLN